MKKLANWINGLIGAAIGGGATAITLMITNPLQYNIEDGLERTITVAGVQALVSAALFLKTHPTPFLEK